MADNPRMTMKTGDLFGVFPFLTKRLIVTGMNERRIPIQRAIPSSIKYRLPSKTTRLYYQQAAQRD